MLVTVERGVPRREKRVSEHQTTAAAEIVTSEAGVVLWIRRYEMSRAYEVGDTFIEQGQLYLVRKVAITFGRFGGALVEHVVCQIPKG
jgi:hypothetical protein